MADKIKKTFQVVGGPSREELFDSLRLFNERRVTTFDIIFVAQPWEQEDTMIMKHHNSRQEVSVYVWGIIACRGQNPGEACEGNLWIISGDLLTHETEPVPVQVVFDTRVRSGHMNHNPDSPMTPGEYDGIVGTNPPDDPELPPEGEDDQPSSRS
jgi:hypothetical protein